MPSRLRRTRRTVRRRRRFVKRRRFARTTVARALVSRSTNTHHFKTRCVVGTIPISAGGLGYASFGISPKLSDLPNSAELGVLYDKYRIDYVKYYIVNRSTNLNMTENYNTLVGFPQLIAVHDDDDATAPSASETGMNEIRQYAKSKFFVFTSTARVFKMGFKPAVLGERYRGVASTSYTPMYHQFIDMTDRDVPHYGFKGVIQSPYTGANFPATVTFDVYATFYVTCSGTR